MEQTYTIEVTKTNRPKSGYKVRWSNQSSTTAMFLWAGLNIGNGYKARMRDNQTNKVIRRKA